MNDDMDEELLNQVGNAMHIVLNEFPPRRFGVEKGNVVLQFFRRCNVTPSAEGFGLGAMSGSRQNMVESSRGHVSSSQPHRRGRYRDLTSSSDSNQQQAMLSK